MAADEAAYTVAWHEAECHGYQVDLPLWLELAGPPPRRLLDLGCGLGRVAGPLAAAGHQVTGLDRDPDLLAEMARRHPAVTTRQADVRDFDLKPAFDLVLAPMQLIQLLLSPADRLACLRAARRALAPDGRLALSLVDLGPDDLPRGVDLLGGRGLSPDLAELPDGRVAVSTTTRLEIDDAAVLRVERRREIIPGPDGEPGPDMPAPRKVSHALQLLTADEFEAELRAAGFGQISWRLLPATDIPMGSAVAIAAPA